MADGDARMNLAALRRVDPYITEIVEDATQVALYKYNSQSNEWEKTEIEGTLFVYARSGDPRYGFMVMNRLNRENLVEPITKDLDVQNKPPFLLYRNAQLKVVSIYGIWFYEESVCSRIAAKMESLIQMDKSKIKAKSERVQANPNTDIISLLTKAHGDYEQKKTGPSEPPSVNGTLVGPSIDVVRPLPVRAGHNMSPRVKSIAPNGTSSLATSLSIADFFGTPTPTPTAAPAAHTELHRSVSLGGPTVGPSLFDKLLGGVTPRVEDFEVSAPQFHTVDSLEQGIRDTLTIVGKDGHVPAASAALPHAHPIHMDVAAFPAPGGLPYTPAKSKPLLHNSKTELLATPLPMTPPRSAELGSCSVPLMSPMMFAPAPKSVSVNTSDTAIATVSSTRPPVSPDLRTTALFPVASSQSIVLPVSQHESLENLRGVTPLTRAQLLQAFNYLLKNDPPFVTQLHEAYVKSLSQSLKPGGS